MPYFIVIKDILLSNNHVNCQKIFVNDLLDKKSCKLSYLTRKIFICQI